MRDFKGDPGTLAVLKTRAQTDNDSGVRRTVVRELARGFIDDPDVLAILKAYAQMNDDYDVRQAAVEELARGFKNDVGLFEFWCDRTLNDPFERKYDWENNPRQITFKVLIQQYPDHPETRALLQDRAQNDNDEQLRKWAAEQLEKLKMQKWGSL